jgi:hypothetical protein
MMDHLTPDEIHRFVAHSLPPERVTHATRCATCLAAARERYDRAAAGRAVAATLLEDDGQDEHLTTEEISRFARGESIGNAREIVESHLEWCPRCADDVEHTHLRSVRSRRVAAIAATLAAGAIGLGAWLFRAPQTTPRALPTSRPPVARVADLWAPRVASARAAGRLAMPDVIKTLRPERGALRGTSASPAHVTLRPAGSVVEDDRPTFRWNRIERAVCYRVLLFEGTRQVMTSEKIATTSWQPPQPLKRDATYEWQLIATLPRSELAVPAPPAPPALFRVLSHSTREDIEAARRAHPGDRLLLGILYAEAGVLDRAEEELRAYADAHRDDANAVALWRSVAAWKSLQTDT